MTKDTKNLQQGLNWIKYIKRRLNTIYSNLGSDTKVWKMLAEKKEYTDRYSTCNKCDKFIKKTKQCSICNCFMPLKVMIKTQKCPHPEGSKWKTNE